jgi:chemotaxis protein CheD
VKHIVGVADMRISGDGEDSIITHALGSCLGIVIHDPVAGVAGMLHVMLPQSSIDPEKATANPYMFVDSGVPKLFRAAYAAGADKSRIVVKVAGGAAVNAAEGKEDYFQIGKRNFVALRNILWKNGILVNSHDVGGKDSRSLSVDVATGEVLVRTNGVTRPL